MGQSFRNDEHSTQACRREWPARRAILLEYDGANALQARYSHGEEIDQPLAMARDVDADGQLAAAERFFYHTDHLGSVRLVTDAAGAVANRYDYDAFGNLETKTDRVPPPRRPFTFHNTPL